MRVFSYVLGVLVLSSCLSREIVAVAPPPVEYTVKFRDETGSVETIRIVDPEPDFMNLHADRLSLTNPVDHVIRVGWLGGRCSESTLFEFQRISGDLTLTFDLGGPCDEQVGVPHYFEITFKNSILADDVFQRPARTSGTDP